MPSTQHAGLHAGFTRPQTRFSPVPLWWWSGERVELPRLRWQLDRLVEQGVHNAVVINLAPTGPLYGAEADDPPLFSDAWWTLWEGVCEHARQRGAHLWFYDQLGFSGANLQGSLVQEDASIAGASLERVVRDVEAGEHGTVEVVCPTVGTPISACVVRLDPEGRVVGTPLPLEVVGGRACWQGTTESPGRHRVMLAYSLRRGFDYTSPAACSRLIDLVHGEFERRLAGYFGDVIVGSFQDELPGLPTWSSTFAEEFARRCGYRIEPVIAALWESGDASFDRVRLDYQRLRATLCEEAFFQPLHEWHEARGLVVGCDPMSRDGEPLRAVRTQADHLRTHRWYGAPGTDHQGEARIPSSLAKHYGRPRVWIEGFHTSGWGVTPEELFDWLVPWFLAGANLYDPHAVFYSTRGGWWDWSGPSTCWRQPYWRHYRHLADTVSRLSWMLTQGEHVCDVGVLYPTATVQAGTLLNGVLAPAERAQDCYLEIVGRMRWFDAAPGVLERDARDLSVLDDDTLAQGWVEGGSLRVPGGSYRAVIVPACTTLEGSTAAVLADLAEGGGLVIFVERVPSQATDEVGQAAIDRLSGLTGPGAESGRAVLVARAADLPAALATLGRRVDSVGPTVHRQVGDRHVLVVPAAPAGSATTQPLLPSRRWWELRTSGYDFDPGRFRRSATVRVTGAIDDVEQWDPLTGAVSSAPARPVDGDTEVEVRFDQAPVAVLVWRAADRHGDEPRRVPDREPEPPSWTRSMLDGSWASTLVSTIDNRFGDLALPPSTEPFPVQQWRLRHQRERPEGGDHDRWAAGDLDDTDWDDVLVGQGTWAWRSELVPASEVEAVEARTPVRYSLSHGIEHDPVHLWARGPSGRVPDEFWRVEPVEAGETVVLRTSLPVDEEHELTLAVAANGEKAVFWNDEPLGPDPGGFLRLDPVRVRRGVNHLEVRVTAEDTGEFDLPMYQAVPLRGYWALVTDPAAFRRPVWIAPEDASRVGSQVVARTELLLPAAPVGQAVLQLGTEGPATLAVNGHEVATQGAFEPYGRFRVLPHDVTEHLRAGDNLLEVRSTDVGTTVAAYVDGSVETADGSVTSVVTDASWTFTRDGRPVATSLRRGHPHDGQWALLRPRAHPLPRARWLLPDHVADALDGVVLDVVPDAHAGEVRPAEWFRVRVPPGATSATLPVSAGTVRAWVDGRELEVGDGRLMLADPGREHRVLAIRIAPADGRTEGALWDAPIEYACGEGVASLGDWADLGLGSYSGGVRYRRRIDVAEASRVELDLGAVRGTAEVHVNGQLAGARLWSPYRFDLTGLTRPGVNDLEVTVFNTLAPYLDDATPTPLVYAGQRRSGLYGPVRLLLADPTSEPSETGCS